MDNVELQATCAALGYQEGDQYHKEPDCLETIKDLIRFLKREDENCDVRRQLGESQILQRDLIPIIKQYQDDRILLETVLRLMVNLTQPGKLCFQNHVPEDKTTRNYYLEVETHLQLYKEAFVDEGLCAVLTKKLGDLLQLDWEHRQEEDRLLIERILIIVRNILHVPPNPAKELRTDDDASVHDQVLWALHISGMEDLLLYLGSAEDEKQFSFHVLEIVSLMFREQTPDQLTSAGGSRSVSEKEKDEKELAMIREQEKAMKKATVMKYSSRHSRFGGTFTVANMKSISERDVVYHRSLGKVKDISFDHNKRHKKRAKNRRIINEQDITRRSTLSIRLFLKEFCVQFLENCYNALMRAIKDTLLRSKAQENDETYYLWAMRFFMEFNRKYNFQVDLVSETLSVPTFHYIQTHLQNFHEMIMSQKKEGIIWSRRMHLALKSYRELLECLGAMDKSQDPSLRESAKVLKSNVFYMLEYRDVFVILLRKFDETRQSRAFLKDLVETTHLFIKMLETFCKGNRHIVVQKKKRNKTARKKKKSGPAQSASTNQPSEQELEDLWDDVSGQLSAIFQGREELPPDVAPFDAASDVDVDQQRASAMCRIQGALRQNDPGEAVALFRAAREVWPDREEFGRPEIAPEEEFMALREVFFAPLPRADVTDVEPQEEEIPEDDPYGDEMGEEEEAMPHAEEEFNFHDFITRFAQQHIVRTYTILLADFKKNSVHTNHCILKMLHRVAFDFNYIGMLFHIRVFRIFQKITTDPACQVKQFSELHQFAKHVVRKFFEVAETNNKIFVELFFWKSSKEAVEVVEGYGSIKANSRKVKQVWSEEQDVELRTLFDQFRDGDDEQDKDVVDLIMDHIIDRNKSRRQILRQLVHLDLIGCSKDVKRKKTAGPRRGTWLEEQELELRHLFDQNKDADDVLGTIIPQMSHPRSKVRVTEKLMELGLVSDRRELHKRRGKGEGSGQRRSKKKNAEEAGTGLENYKSAEFVDINDDSSDDDTRPRERESSASDSEGSEGTSSSDEENSTEPEFVKQIRKAVKRVISKGLQGPIEWIKKCLKRTADDREEDDDDEPIPVVPLEDEHDEAMETSVFRALLKRVGLKPPSNEQERYWRIPGYLTPADLRSRVTALEPSAQADGGRPRKNNNHFASLQALVKQKKLGRRERSIRDNEASEANTSQQTNSSGDEATPTDSSRPERLSSPQPGSQGDSNHGNSSQGDNNHGDSSKEGHSDGESSQGDSNHGDNSQEDHSDGDSSQGDTNHGDTQPVIAGNRKRSRIQRSLNSDSENSDGAEGEADDNRGSVTEHPPKRARFVDDEDSDKENMPAEGGTEGDQLKTFPATMMSQPLTDSDSDLDDHIPLKRAVKRPAIASDSDDD